MYRKIKSIDDANSLTLHSALDDLDNKNTNVRMLFIDSSAINTTIQNKLITKLLVLLGISMCNWLLDILLGRPQPVKIGHNLSLP